MALEKYDRSCFFRCMKSKQTKQRLLNTGLDLLSVEGLEGLSIGRVAAEAGLSKSGLFAHVQSKQALEIELFDASAELAYRTYVEEALKQPAGFARLRALVEGWLGWSGKAGLRGGCPVAAALFELDDRPGPVRDHVAMLESRWRQLLLQLTAETIEAGEFRKELDPEQFVWELCGIYLSHHASSRFMHDPESGPRAVVALEALFERAKSHN